MIKNMSYFLLILSFFSLAHGEELKKRRPGQNRMYAVFPKDKYAGQPGKNGIDLTKILKNFDKNFSFVSSHYREDKLETRLIYGNKLAMEGLRSPDYKFKDGAILYKVVYLTEHDPNFDASLVPESQPLVRQVMVHDSKKYKKYNGWGYAVFTERGDTLSGDPEATLDTCYACHQLVEGRNNVFSIPMDTIVPNNKIPSLHYEKEGKMVSKNKADPNYTKDGLAKSKLLSEKLFSFKMVPMTAIDQDIRIHLNQKGTQVNLLDGEMMNQKFPGYMTEISSFLIKETLKNGYPSVATRSFLSQTMFSFSFIDTEPNQCQKGERLVRYGWGKVGDSSDTGSQHNLKKCFP